MVRYILPTVLVVIPIAGPCVSAVDVAPLHCGSVGRAVWHLQIRDCLKTRTRLWTELPEARSGLDVLSLPFPASPPLRPLLRLFEGFRRGCWSWIRHDCGWRPEEYDLVDDSLHELTVDTAQHLGAFSIFLSDYLYVILHPFFWARSLRLPYFGTSQKLLSTSRRGVTAVFSILSEAVFGTR